MAKDEYDRLVCTILVFLYARLKKKEKKSPEDYLIPMTKDFPIDTDYFNFVLLSMVDEGYITGPKAIRAWGGEIVRMIDIDDIRITPDGIHYLSESDRMKKVLEFFRDTAVQLLPGMLQVATGLLAGI